MIVIMIRRSLLAINTELYRVNIKTVCVKTWDIKSNFLVP